MSPPGTPPPLADGSYDVIVVDATPTGDGRVSIEVAVTTGPAKGQVVGLLAGDDLAAEPLDLLGLPGVVTVTSSEPRFALS